MSKHISIEQLFSNIANAIRNKTGRTGVIKADDFPDVINNIVISSGIDTSEATATAADILKDKIAYNSSGKITGTMFNIGTQSKTLNAGESITISKGYHNGLGEIIANSLAPQTSATATADKILKGYTAWVNGELITGTYTTSTSTDSHSGGQGN